MSEPMTRTATECIYCGEEIVPLLNGHICDEHDWMQHTENLTSRITTLQAENAKQKYCIEQMIQLAAAKHRPAYDEQQTVIMGLRDEIAALKAEVARARPALIHAWYTEFQSLSLTELIERKKKAESRYKREIAQQGEEG